MRILIAASIYPPDPGGPALHAQKQFEWFKNNGRQVDLVALAQYRKWPRGVRHLFFFFDLLIKSLRSEVIYAHDALGVGLPALICSRITGNKLVLRIGGDLAWEREADSNKTNLSMLEWYVGGFYKHNNLYFLTKKTLQQADAVIVSTELLYRIYTKYYEIDQKKLNIITNSPAEPVPIINIQSENTIIYASRLVAYKNLPFVLNILSRLFKQNSEIKFLIMGDGPERHNLEELSKKLNISNRVIFTGSIPQTEVLKRTASCRLAIAPALTEFSPNYIMQSISYHKPFLISKENGLPFDVPESFVFDPRNENELESKITSILKPEKYLSAVEEVKSIDLDYEVTWNDVLSKNFEILKKVLNGSK